MTDDMHSILVENRKFGEGPLYWLNERDEIRALQKKMRKFNTAIVEEVAPKCQDVVFTLEKTPPNILLFHKPLQRKVGRIIPMRLLGGERVMAFYPFVANHDGVTLCLICRIDPKLEAERLLRIMPERVEEFVDLLIGTCCDIFPSTEIRAKCQN